MICRHTDQHRPKKKKERRGGWREENLRGRDEGEGQKWGLVLGATGTHWEVGEAWEGLPEHLEV